MAWHAKPYGGYGYGTQEGKDNIDMIYSYFSAIGWSLEAISGIVGNMIAESGLNPWRWQSDSVSLTSDSKGYGLVQLTPAYGYIYGYGVGVSGFGPNLSTSEITEGAKLSDGHAQLIVISQDLAGKYSVRPWCPAEFRITWNNFKNITSVRTATGAWLYNYESPEDVSSKLTERLAYANWVYEYISGHPPPTPGGGTLPIWLMKYIKDKRLL